MPGEITDVVAYYYYYYHKFSFTTAREFTVLFLPVCLFAVKSSKKLIDFLPSKEIPLDFNVQTNRRNFCHRFFLALTFWAGLPHLGFCFDSNVRLIYLLKI